MKKKNIKRNKIYLHTFWKQKTTNYKKSSDTFWEQKTTNYKKRSDQLNFPDRIDHYDSLWYFSYIERNIIASLNNVFVSKHFLGKS